MLLYIVRHGKPDYVTDTLLDEGKTQATLVAERLEKSGIDKIYSSPQGRAIETAQPLSERLKLPINIEHWARELGKESKTTYPDGELKLISSIDSKHYHDEKYRLMSTEESLEKVDGLKDMGFRDRYHEITLGLDSLLEKNGYKRNEKGFYDMVSPNEKHIALFCHIGMTRVLVSHLMHIPYHFFASSLMIHFTGISIFYFPLDSSKQNGDVCPQLYCIGDVGHLYNQNKSLLHYKDGIKF